jgi:hypothetical protein
MADADPYARAKAIRRGEIDDEMPAYEELTGWLQRVPVTWLPALLTRVVALCVIRQVFREGGLQVYVDRGVEIGTDPNLSALRDEQL